MKLSWGLLASSLYCAASAAAAVRGHVYTFDPASTTKRKDALVSVSPETVRLILAQRLGLSRFHSLSDKMGEEDVVELLNKYGGKTQQLFGQDSGRSHAHALIWLDQVKPCCEIIAPAHRAQFNHDFGFSTLPPPSANAKLVKDILTQAHALPKYADPQLVSYESTVAIDDILKGVVEQANHISTHYQSFAGLGRGRSEAVESYSQIISALFNAAKKHNFSFTVIITPEAGVNSKASYGAYTIPSSRNVAREEPEAYISAAAAPIINTTHPADHAPVSIYEKEQGPLLGILKTCYRSQSGCESATRNCSSHGACSISKHKTDKQTADCWSCKCEATVKKVGEGKDNVKTTNWGGPACQKKDVVIEFWLFAGMTVLLMFLIGAGIGMLYSMGEEELPSVIGAGVSGPQKK